MGPPGQMISGVYGQMNGSPIVKAAINASGIIHLMFADDILIFTKTGMHNIAGIMNVLDQFGKVSGQILNLGKSSVCFSNNISHGARHDLAKELNMSEMLDTDKYLGAVTLLLGRNKIKAFKPIMHSFGSRLKIWKEKIMDHSARSIMIKHVLNAFPSHQMDLKFLKT
ncbi:uncharacterized protein LOC113280252 [Papaver somniferum]|uniref:uncharacterized protein LOC113280252 n=1 Tax=Papaver somniferum TaxID=3469 RepID=UPI000E705973|nr:uncharacterized protein LOC113280252 [Papaver somniferum]